MHYYKKVLDKKYILRGLRLAILISLLISAFLIIFTIDTDSLLTVGSVMSSRYILYLVIVVILSWAFAALRLKLLLSTVGYNISFRSCFEVYLSGAFVSNVTPFASGGGPFQVYFLHKKGVNIGKSSTVVVIQFLIRLFFFGLLTPIFFIFFNWAVSSGVIPGSLFYLAFGSGIAISVGIILLVLIPGIMDKIINTIFRIKKLKKFVKNSYRAKRMLVKARAEMRDFRYSMEIMRGYKLELFVAWLFTAIRWSLMFIIVPLILLGMGLDPHFFRAYVMMTLIYLILPYMPSPGASGIAEVGVASLFVSFVPGSYVGLVTFAWRLFTFYAVLMVGGPIALKEIGRSGE